MANSKESDHDLFTEVKEAFGRLELDQKATFLVTESVNTAVEAVSTVVEMVTGECAQFFGNVTTATEETTPEPTEAKESDSPKDETV